MIKNERQYRITKTQADKFEQALRSIVSGAATDYPDPIIRNAQINALESQHGELREEIAEYESLRTDSPGVFDVASFDELPEALIKARIALGLSQKDLADRLGLKEQQLQRYEATNYASASLERTQEIVNALGLRIRKDVFLPSVSVTLSKLFRTLRESGLDKDFVVRRLLPLEVASKLGSAVKGDNSTLALQAASRISRILKCPVPSLFAGGPIGLDTAAIGAVRYKVPRKTNERKLSAYTVYAIYLAHLTLEVTADLPQTPIPSDSALLRSEVESIFGTLTFENVLKYFWSKGLPVLPLRDSGAFHGASIREKGRNVVVLKQQTSSTARWLNDALHEGYHTSQEPEQEYREVIELPEKSSERIESEEEYQAILFASQVMLKNRADELAEKSVQVANGSVEQLKSAVQKVAREEGVAVDALANYLAFRLSREKTANWWGVAAKLQELNGQPWLIARDLFLKNANFGRLNEIDRSILLQALSEEEEV